MQPPLSMFSSCIQGGKLSIRLMKVRVSPLAPPCQVQVSLTLRTTSVKHLLVCPLHLVNACLIALITPSSGTADAAASTAGADESSAHQLMQDTP